MNKEKFLQDAKASYAENPTMARVYDIYCGKYFVSYNGYFGMVFDKADNVENLFENGACNSTSMSNLFSDNAVFSNGKILLNDFGYAAYLSQLKRTKYKGKTLQMFGRMAKESYHYVYIQKKFLKYFSEDAEFYSSARSENKLEISGVFVVENGEIVGYIMPVNVDRR